jgi:hypothetical protein
MPEQCHGGASLGGNGVTCSSCGVVGEELVGEAPAVPEHGHEGGARGEGQELAACGSTARGTTPCSRRARVSIVMEKNVSQTCSKLVAPKKGIGWMLHHSSDLG